MSYLKGTGKKKKRDEEGVGRDGTDGTGRTALKKDFDI